MAGRTTAAGAKLSLMARLTVRGPSLPGAVASLTLITLGSLPLGTVASLALSVPSLTVIVPTRVVRRPTLIGVGAALVAVKPL